MSIVRAYPANKAAFNELIKAYRAKGYMLITYGVKLAELEKNNVLVVLKIRKAVNKNVGLF